MRFGVLAGVNGVMKLSRPISVNLWFDTQAEEAANYYVGIFENSRIERVTHYTKEGKEVHGMPEGSVMTVEFYLDGQQFIALNGGPIFKFNEAISLVIGCDTQAEIDYFWDKLSAGGDPSAQQCGWLKDKFGVSWQVVPNMLSQMYSTSGERHTAPLMRAMLKMHKLDIAKLEAAFTGEEALW